MFLTAHRVYSPRSGRAGINTFSYRHGEDPSIDWTNPDPVAVSEGAPGVLVSDAIEVAPGGNLVRSYVDVVAHDDTSFSAIEDALKSARARVHGALPIVTRGRVGVRFGAELGLAEDAWGSEFDELGARALSLLRAPPVSSWRGLDPVVIAMSVEGDQTAFHLAAGTTDRLKAVAGEHWVPSGIVVRREVRDDLAFYRGDILREIARALLPNVSDEELLRLGGVRVVDASGALVVEWPARRGGGTGYCLQCHQHNTLRSAGAEYRCSACGNVQKDNGLWIAAQS
jgi:hypothetical protein